MLNQDFKEFAELLNDNRVQYMVVGGYAVAIQGYPRYTKDIDIGIKLDPENKSYSVFIKYFLITGPKSCSVCSRITSQNPTPSAWR